MLNKYQCHSQFLSLNPLLLSHNISMPINWKSHLITTIIISITIDIIIHIIRFFHTICDIYDIQIIQSTQNTRENQNILYINVMPFSTRVFINIGCRTFDCFSFSENQKCQKNNQINPYGHEKNIFFNNYQK